MLVITPEHYLVVFGIKYRDYGILTVEIKSHAWLEKQKVIQEPTKDLL